MADEITSIADFVLLPVYNWYIRLIYETKIGRKIPYRFLDAVYYVGHIINVAQHNNLRVTYALYWKDLTDPFTWIGYGRTILSYYISLWLFNYLFSRKLYYVGVISIIFLIAFDVFLRYLIEQLFIGPVFNLWQFHQDISIKEYYMETVFYSAIGIFLSFVLKIINDFFVNEQINQERISMELQFLKSQVNPHFLFNSFNNLYGLSLTEPQKTPDAILKLAELTRYMIYDSKELKVTLLKEITYLQDLVELQKLRYEQEVYISFTIAEHLSEYTIAPLLLISFVENAFKHGEVNDMDNPVIISLTMEENRLKFYVANKINNQNKDFSGGIGLKNVRRRLELLYPGKYELQIKNDRVSYCSDLKLVLS